MSCKPFYKGKQFNSLKELAEYLENENKFFSNISYEIKPGVQDIEGFKEFVQEKQFQKLTTEEKAKTIEQVTKEHRSITALKDLSAKLAWRIGGEIKFENRTDVDWKGYNQGMKSVLNEAYMTPDTPFHEILAHPIIRGIKNRRTYYKTGETAEFHGYGEPYRVTIEKIYGDTLEADIIDRKGSKQKVDLFELSKPQNTLLYKSLLKELETGRGKEVFEQVKRDYKYKYSIEKVNHELGNYRIKSSESGARYFDTYEEAQEALERYAGIKYTLEEQQEEAIVTLLGLMAADKLDAKKDATLISKLKELWKQISDFVRSLLRQDGIKIDELPITTTLNDLANIMAYGNNKIILPGYKVEYSTPLGNKYETLEEVNNEIRGLADANVEVDLKNVNINKETKILYEVINNTTGEYEIFETEEEAQEYKQNSEYEDAVNTYRIREVKDKNNLEDFIEKNKEYEQSKEIIEQWKKENNIKYDPEEVYSRGHQFISTMGAFGKVDLGLLFQNMLQHLEDYNRIGAKFELSFHTAPIDNRQVVDINQGGGKVYIVAYPQSNDIAWASKRDNYSGSVWEANKKVTDKPSEIAGVAHTKAPSVDNIDTIEPNLATIIDERNWARNELGVAVTPTNHRVEYDESVPYEIKKLINNYNKILDDKYGKLEKPEIKPQTDKEYYFPNGTVIFEDENGKYKYEEDYEEVLDGDGNITDMKVVYNKKRITNFEFVNIKNNNKGIYTTKNNITGKQPTQTRENTTSIESVLDNYNKNDRYIPSGDVGYVAKDDLGNITDVFDDIKKAENQVELWQETNPDDGWRVEKINKPKEKEYTSQAETNLKIAALKEVARKYPRSLITSKVVPINPNMVDNSERQYSKVNSQANTENNLFQDIETEDYIPQTAKIIKLKQQRLSNLYRRLSQIKNDKEIFSNNSKKLSELLSEQNEINFLIHGNKDNIGLKQEIENLKNKTTFENLLSYVDSDVERLERLIYSEDINERQEANEIINFYESLNPLEGLGKMYGNPFFENSFIFDENNNLTEDFKEVFKQLEPYLNKVLEIKAKMEIQDKQYVLRFANSDERVQNTFNRGLTSDELFEKKGAKDINYLTMFMQDPEFQFGITSKNPLLAQLSKFGISDAIYKNRIYASYLDERIKKIEPDLLISLTNNKGFFGQPDFNIFRLKDKDGLYTDTIIQRFNPILSEQENQVLDDFEIAARKVFAQRESSKNKNQDVKALKLKLLNWYRENYEFLDIRNIPEVVKEFPFMFNEKHKIDNKYTEKLKNTLGEYGYKEEIDKQIKKIKEYIIQEELFDEEYKNRENFDTEKYIEDKKIFISKNNPIEFLNKLDKFETDNNTDILNFKDLVRDFYLIKIPRKYKAIVINNRYIKETNEETGYYLKEFEQIEKDPTLKEFHNILIEFLNDIYNNVDIEDRKNFNLFSIPAIEKTIIDILKDKDLTILEKISESFKYLIQKLKEFIREHVPSSTTYGHLDPITGKPTYNINTDFLNFNKSRIISLTSQNINHFKEILKLDDRTIQDFNINLDNGIILNFLSKNLGIEPSVEALIRMFPDINFNKFNLENLVERVVTNYLVMNQSSDLPKIIRNLSYAMAAYKGRKEALPLLTMLKNQYTSILKPEVNKHGEPLKDKEGNILLSEKRDKAIKQYNSWFNRVVLGNYEKKSSLSTFIDTKLNKKIGINKIDEFFNKEQDDKEKSLSLEDQIKENKLRNRKISFTAIMDNIVFSSIRFLGLGYNVSSAFTNFFEGQFSNLINAKKYFPEEYIYEGIDIIKYSTLRTVFGDKGQNIEGFKKAKLLRYLMDNYDVLQDVYNEMQRASVKSRINKLSKLNSKELVSRVEYNNQAPVFYSILKDTKIKGKDGNETSLWDAFYDGINEGKEVGKLSDNYSTENNISNYEIEKDQTFHNKDYVIFKSRVVDTIKKLHGDYDELSGNLASESIEGNALFMFKRWLGSYLYTRYGTEQYNLHTQRLEKGRYRSLTSTTAGMYGSIAGLIAFGPLGGIIGASMFVAPRVFNMFGIQAKTNVLGDNLTLIQEIAETTKQLASNFISLPVNILTGKKLMKGYDSDKLEKNYSKIDVDNIKANLVEMSILLWTTALLLLVKGIAWDDDDEEDSKRRKFHNIAVNKLMQLSDQSLTFLEPTKTYDSFFGADGIAPIRFLNNVIKTVDATIKYINGEDIIQTGINAGESRLGNIANKTFLPSPFRGFGFESLSKRQFKPSPFDKYFLGEEEKAKKEIRKLKANEKSELNYYDLSEEEQKELDKKLRQIYTKDKDETYKEKLDELEE